VQKEAWFTKINPNGRIPAIVDHDKGGYAVMEGLAILNYLARNYDPEHQFSFEDSLEQCTAEQWLAWQHGGLGKFGLISGSVDNLFHCPGPHKACI
jgi:glutathione S-transferase